MSSVEQAQMEKPKPIRMGNGRWWLLLIALTIHLCLLWINLELSRRSIEYFLGVIIRLIPAFGLMFILLTLFHLFFKPQQINRHLGDESGIRGWFYAILGGVVSMGPMFLWYPLLSDLKAKGMRYQLLTAFLYSRAIKIPMLPFMFYYFGGLYTVIFVGNVLMFSLLSGVSMGMIMSEGKQSNNETA